MFLDPFPRTVNTKVLVSKQSLETYKLFFDCQMPDFADDILACDGCDRWIHLRCAGFRDLSDVPKRYMCQRCS